MKGHTIIYKSKDGSPSIDAIINLFNIWWRVEEGRPLFIAYKTDCFGEHLDQGLYEIHGIEAYYSNGLKAVCTEGQNVVVRLFDKQTHSSTYVVNHVGLGV